MDNFSFHQKDEKFGLSLKEKMQVAKKYFSYTLLELFFILIINIYLGDR